MKVRVGDLKDSEGIVWAKEIIVTDACNKSFFEDVIISVKGEDKIFVKMEQEVCTPYYEKFNILDGTSDDEFVDLPRVEFKEVTVKQWVVVE